MRPLAFIIMALLPTLAVADMISISVPSAVREAVDVYRAECTDEGSELELDDGAELTSEELEALRTAMAENDFDGWDSHSGFYFKVRFGALYALFVGQDLGQGGNEFELERVFANKKLAVQHALEKPMVAFEIK